MTSRPEVRISSGRTLRRKWGLASRSGLSSSRSTSPSSILSNVSCQSSRLEELTVAAWMPSDFGRVELVAHQRDQRRDEDRRAGAALAQHRGGDEVDGALSPPGPLHAEDAAAALDDLVDRLELAVAELGAAVAGEATEEVEGGGRLGRSLRFAGLRGGFAGLGCRRHEPLTLGGRPKCAEPAWAGVSLGRRRAPSSSPGSEAVMARRVRIRSDDVRSIHRAPHADLHRRGAGGTAGGRSPSGRGRRCRA